MEQDPEVVDHLEQFRAMGTIELTYLWEEPMPESVRELLLAELRERHYRIKSLPEPLGAAALPADGSLPGPKPLSTVERAERQVRNAVGMILLVAVVQLGYGIYQCVEGWRAISAQAATLEGMKVTETVLLDGEEYLVEDARIEYGVARALTVLLTIGPGLRFIALAFLARIVPRPAILTALLVYVGLVALNVYLDPSTVTHGIAIKILIVMTLIWGVRGAYQAELADDPDGEPDPSP